ncbi:MAG: tripartite tricarboxylate transporter substrate binding protein [Betaproteobacteria bacterium]|nr:tripartite tricarboxylate transporter substrate binding protein [Betaproteobacteria bacterium]
MKVWCFLLPLFFLGMAQAQTYPVKPIRLVVPFAPGGSSSIVARAVAAEMEKGLGQSIVIDNKPGGGGNVAMLEVARADPDGYTLIIGHVGSLAMNPYMYDKLPYDVDKDFAPISLLALVPAIFVVHESVPAKDLREFVALAKKEPGKMNYGSAGNGSAGHLAMEYLKQATGIDIQHVPYKGTGPNVIDLVAGRTQAAAAGTPPLMPHVKAGKLRVIAVGTPQRLATLADVATVAEQGYPGFETSQWYGLNAPAKTPAAVIQRLAAEAAKAAQSPKVVERFAADDAQGIGSSPLEYAAFVKKEQARWSKVVRAAKIKAD